MDSVNIRKLLGQYAFVVFCAAVLLVIGGLALLNRHAQASDEGMNVWYYDLGTNQLFSAAPDSIPPIQAPPDPKKPDVKSEGVRALVFSCGSCRDASKRFVAYVEKYTPEGKAKRELAPEEHATGSRMPASEKELRGIDPEDAHDGLVIAKVDSATPAEEWKWTPKSDDAVAAIEEEAAGRCKEGETLQPCVPRSP
ncbi:MAG: hypothetical protein NTW19_14090 [Planctomycetota bacterium]|nr:hypothetical protein [Planctomycetota bacterium]